jgi:FkbM family methyltransferase
MDHHLVYDIGMNNGDDSAYYLERGYRVVAVDANPILVDEVRNRFSAEVDAGKLVILNVGVADSEGSLDFWINEDVSEWSSFDKEIAGRKNHKLRRLNVQTCRLDSIMREYGVPYYLKIDVEGFDRVCIECLIEDDLPGYLSLETCDVDTLSLIHRLGYDAFKCIDQHDHRALIAAPHGGWRVSSIYSSYRHSPYRLVRATAAGVGSTILRGVLQRHRVSAYKRFPRGSSGAFAEELPGYWMRFEEALHTLLSEKLKCMADGRPLWVDVHARRLT